MKSGYFRSLTGPLSHPIFRALWIATVFSNVGTLMHGVGAAWLMTSMTTSPLLVGLVPACVLMPAFLVGIWGGVLADLVERRRILIVTQLAMALTALVLGVTTVSGHISPPALLVLTFFLGSFNALNMPAWQSQIQDIIPASQVAAAVSLNSMSFNTARSVGPAIGGLLVAAHGPALVFFLNAASFLGTVFVLLAWKRPPFQRPKTRVLQSLREGFVFAIFSPIMRAPLVRVSSFAFAAASIWAVIPLLARETLRTDAWGYGLLLGAFGLGSVITGGIVPGLRTRWHPDRIAGPAIIVIAIAFMVLGLTTQFGVAFGALFVAGLAWVAVLIQFNVAVQLSVPGHLRGRALAFYFAFFQGAMGIGSAFSGWVAKQAGIPFTLVLGGTLILLGLPLIRWLPLDTAAPDR